jgi:glycosyltransferase involved in cell wall biosynthesis
MNIFNPKNSNKLIIYVNPGFTGVHGYYKNHATKFLKEIRRTGIALLHLTHKDLSLDLAVRYKASLAFSQRPHLTLSSAEDVRTTISEEFYCKMGEVFQREDVRAFEDVIVYMYSGHPLYAAELSKAIKEFDLKVKAFVNFLYNEKELENIEEALSLQESLKRWGRVLQDNDKDGQVVLTVDCPKARDLYSGFLGRDIELLPAGCAMLRRAQDTVRDSFRSLVRSRDLNVLYMGYSHRKYGYKLVKSLYDSSKDLKLHFHIRHQDAHLQADHKETREKWLKQNFKIDHHTGFIDEHNYDKLIRNADIVVIPYLKKEYPYQTSGVFIEALSMNKVIVATRGTWFGNAVEFLGVGEVFESGDATSLIEAMKKVVDNYYTYREKAVKHGARYRDYWSVKNLFSSLGISNNRNRTRLIDDVY